MILKSNITGLVLAGGQGSRMGLVDKGLMPFRGATLVAAVLRRLTPQVGPVLINANQNLASYTAFGWPVWPDQLSGHAGPLAGLQTALRHCVTDYLLVVPCDSPFLADNLASRLAHALVTQQADVALATTLHERAGAALQVQRHPVFCLLKTSILPQLDAYLAAGGRRMDGWYGRLNVAEVAFDDAAAFDNLNTLAQLHEADTPRAPASGGLDALASCLSAYDPDALPVADAQRLITAYIEPIDGVDTLPLFDALDRVLAQDILSPISVPAYDNSAMDGYALRGQDLAPDGTTTLRLIGTTFAGRPADVRVGRGECVRIMTGGLMPDGCDSVVPQELVQAVDGAYIQLAAGAIRAGDNRRLVGEDLPAGGLALPGGKLLRPAELGLLASLGISAVPVRRRLRVAFFSTGDELRGLGQPLEPGCVYDSNRYTLFGMLRRLGCDIIDLGIVRDEPQALATALRDACVQADAIITSGGVSVGAADYTRQIMDQLGDVRFWKIGMRPGRPLAFGKIQHDGHSAFLFGLPGNPVAVMVSFYFFARGALLHMMGASAALPPPLLQASASAPIRKRPGRTEFQRGIVSTAADGRPQVRLTGAQGSGILSSMTQANCIVVLGDQQGNVAAGDPVDVLLFDGLV